MGSTHTALLLHIVFSTKGRSPWITDDVRDRLFEYLGGAVQGQSGMPLAIGGMPDHVHLLISWRPDETISTLLREIKAQSSRWIHATFPTLGDFRWQDGYAAFSVSPSQRERVEASIENQPNHHRKADFKQELTALLTAHGVEYDERYL
jgi:REP-associated tyrosine transposase